ncbi:ATP-dependent DNA helicase DinG [Virgibacillus dakarensis]|uniref:3'-5' exonuclease DinG n=1 Tax=Lentibacillus populi TaxID=1827502 RepID=A0A9W5X4Q2_9BACI|nr:MULTISPECIES: ATP-dependent DNA helicase DinG [Bacillaceae]MBT2214240.1 ATP-dependent DNA helicase DinG [Virgibacillus dakarensis]MTW85935.1 ATP-dependent DNA helicase DinG [Virgibacillus dakarensis]GGB33268.1 ATP-dependent helicase DinG [Lentibacillus populi]
MDKFVVIDLETTGHSPANNDKIIEVGIVTIERNEISNEFSTLLNPEKEISPFITNLTGIADQDVADAPTFREKADEITALFHDSYLIAHNVPFDLGFLNQELAKQNKRKLTNPVLDTVELSRILYPQAPSFKLAQIADYVNIHHDDPHRALSDAYVTAKLFLKLKQKLESLPYETIEQLLKLEKMLKSDLYQLLDDRLKELAFTIENNDDIASYRGLAFKEIREYKRNKPKVDFSYGDYLDHIYETNGSMQQQMSHYEKRTGQREMSEHIYDAFQSGQHALIEAETGTGKSLAYLIPAIYQAVKEKQRIVISTYTTPLQSQLLDEEIPFVHHLIPFPFKAALLKGKQHYISLEKFEHELSSGQTENYDFTLTKAMILVWLTETETGDIDEIQLPSSGYLFFKRVSVDTEGYPDPASPWFQKSFYQHAKRQAQKADIVITNHALLCTDIFNDYQFLPSYEKAIIDEAHHLEETASKHYGLRLDYASIHYSLNHIGTIDETNWLGKLISSYSFNPNETLIDNWNDIFERVKYEVDDLFRYLFQYVTDQQKNEKSFSDIGRTQYRIKSGQEHPKKWNTIKEMATRLIFYFRDLIHMLAQLEQYLVKQEQLEKNDKDEIEVTIEKLQRFIDHLEQLFLLEDEENHVKWIEIEASGAKNAVYLYSEPINMANLLASDFFEEKQSVILTSATLTMKRSFSFIQNRLGLSADRLITKKINSPFTYQNQVQLMVPNDFPDVKYGNITDFIYATCEAILSLAEITKGRMLVLFTSYDMLHKSYGVLKETMDLSRYMLIAQGISSGSRSRLKKNFIHYEQSILLGTSSFWEGVDIPGEDLSCLVIVRLPFEPPDHPIYEAKANFLKHEGKNAFMELSLPNAVIRFKQGFGRLIRSASDRGVVFVCDARIIKARYGKYFTESIPDVPITFDSTQKLIEKAEQWF